MQSLEHLSKVYIASLVDIRSELLIESIDNQSIILSIYYDSTRITVKSCVKIISCDSSPR